MLINNYPLNTLNWTSGTAFIKLNSQLCMCEATPWLGDWLT